MFTAEGWRDIRLSQFRPSSVVRVRLLPKRDRRYLFVRLYAISAVRATEEETIALIDTYRKWLAFLELETQVT